MVRQSVLFPQKGGSNQTPARQETNLPPHAERPERQLKPQLPFRRKAGKGAAAQQPQIVEELPRKRSPEQPLPFREKIRERLENQRRIGRQPQLPAQLRDAPGRKAVCLLQEPEIEQQPRTPQPAVMTTMFKQNQPMQLRFKARGPVRQFADELSEGRRLRPVPVRMKRVQMNLGHAAVPVVQRRQMVVRRNPRHGSPLSLRLQRRVNLPHALRQPEIVIPLRPQHR